MVSLVVRTGSRPKPARGFTILEILLVLALSFVGLFGMTTLLTVAQRSAGAARAMTEATALAQDRLEQLGHQSVNTLVGGIEATLGPLGAAIAGGAYTRATTVTTNGQTTTIRVNGSWRDTQQRIHGVTLITQRAL